MLESSGHGRDKEATTIIFILFADRFCLTWRHQEAIEKLSKKHLIQSFKPKNSEEISYL